LLLRFYHYQTNEATHSPLLLTWRATFPLQRGRGRENDPSCPCIFSECLLSYFLAMTSGPHTQDLSSTSRASADCYALARPRTAPGARGGGGWVPRPSGSSTAAAQAWIEGGGVDERERVEDGERATNCYQFWSLSGLALRPWTEQKGGVCPSRVQTAPCASPGPGPSLRGPGGGGCRGPTASRGHITGHQAGGGERSGRIPGLASSIRLLQCNVETIILIIK
jgi:hypothetical protein